MKLIIHSSTSPWNKIQVKLQQKSCLRLECQSHHHVLLVCRAKKRFFFFFAQSSREVRWSKFIPFALFWVWPLWWKRCTSTAQEAEPCHPPSLLPCRCLQDCLYSCGKLGYTSKSSPKAPHRNLLQWDVTSFQSGSQGRAHLMNLAKVKTH